MQARGEQKSRRQLGLLWGGVAVALVALAPIASDVAQRAPACPVKTLSGVPCLTCGATRSAVALAGGRLLEALVVNPLATLAWLGVIVGGLVAGGAALAGRPLREPGWRWRPRQRLGVVAVVVGNWLYLVWAGT